MAKFSPPKVEFFLWLALLGKLNTKAMLLYKGIRFEGSPNCPFCSAHIETLDHILMTCSVSWRLWCGVANDFGRVPEVKETFRQYFSHWMDIHVANKIQRKFLITSFFVVA
uniref:Reverse transcriptase zinc-binding domain-containing protein n=1 Tax=Opuntia streptacantha TaxID=393608 RepID=A0A7C9CGM1_OPUST